MSLSGLFAASFDTSSRVHVEWLKTFHHAATSPEGPNRALAANPMKVKYDPTVMEHCSQTAEIHFVLAMKYVDGIFNNHAYISPCNERMASE